MTGPSGPLLAGATSWGVGCAEADVARRLHGGRRPSATSSTTPSPRTRRRCCRPPPAGPGSATVTFAPGPTDHGVDVTGYTVMASPGGLTKTVPAGATSATFTGLANGTTYSFTVLALLGHRDERCVEQPPPSRTTSALGTYTGVTPQRLVDTRQSGRRRRRHLAHRRRASGAPACPPPTSPPSP